MFTGGMLPSIPENIPMPGEPAHEPTSVASMPAQELSQEALPSAAAEHWDPDDAAVDFETDLNDAAVDFETLQQQATQRINADLPKSIINAFLNYLPLRDELADQRVTEFLEDETNLSNADLAAIAMVFESAFIWYVDPLKRTEFVSRDTLLYVRAWQELACYRNSVGKDAYFDGTNLSEKDRQSCYQAYLKDFRRTPLLPWQKNKNLRSYANAHLRDLAANTMIAWAIWEVGVPRLELATEQPDTHPQEGHIIPISRPELDENIFAILGWLDGVARSIIQYHQTPMYREAVRRAGTKTGSGLTEAEQTQRAQFRRARADVRKGKNLAELWDKGVITFATVTEENWAVLQKHWNGSDVSHLKQTQEKRGERRITMPELWPQRHCQNII